MEAIAVCDNHREIFFSLLEGLPGGLLLVDRAGCLISANRVAADICGIVGRSVSGRDCWQLLRETFATDEQTLAPLKTPSGRVILNAESDMGGVRRYLLSRNELASPFAAVRGFILQFVEIGIEDLARDQETRRSRYDAMRGLAARMETMVRERLGSIELYASLLHRSLASDEENGPLAARILEVAHALAPALDNFTSFASLPEPHYLAFDLEGLLSETKARLEIAGGGSDVVSLDTGGGAGEMFADRVMIGQLLLNLGFNAMEHGGTPPLFIGLDRPTIEGRTFLRIVVRDQGPGLSPAVKERMFDPFFTTRPGAMGLGLTVANAIVEAHSGVISGDNYPDGAEFMVMIPQ